MFKFILYDDNELELNLLADCIKTACTNHNIQHTIYKYSNDVQALEYSTLNKGRSNIYLLDIMSDSGVETGLKIAEQIRTGDHTAYIVFITGHQEYALLSFRRQPFDFILKPYDDFVICDLISRIKSHFNAVYNEHHPYFALQSGSVTNKIFIREITYLEKDNNLLIVHTVKGIYKGYLSFKDSLNILSKYGFCLCHKSYIVNPNSPLIECINKNKKENKIIFKNGDICYMSRNYKKVAFGNECLLHSRFK